MYIVFLCTTHKESTYYLWRRLLVSLNNFFLNNKHLPDFFLIVNLKFHACAYHRSDKTPQQSNTKNSVVGEVVDLN